MTVMKTFMLLWKFLLLRVIKISDWFIDCDYCMAQENWINILSVNWGKNLMVKIWWYKYRYKYRNKYKLVVNVLFPFSQVISSERIYHFHNISFLHNAFCVLGCIYSKRPHLLSCQILHIWCKRVETLGGWVTVRWGWLWEESWVRFSILNHTNIPHRNIKNHEQHLTTFPFQI